MAFFSKSIVLFSLVLPVFMIMAGSHVAASSSEEWFFSRVQDKDIQAYKCDRKNSKVDNVISDHFHGFFTINISVQLRHGIQ